MRYLLMVQFNPGSDQTRLIRDVPNWIETIRRFSGGEQENAYRSSDGLTFGLAFKLTGDMDHLKRLLLASSFFLTGDSMVIVELGELVIGKGASRFWTWLQHHR